MKPFTFEEMFFICRCFLPEKSGTKRKIGNETYWFIKIKK